MKILVTTLAIALTISGAEAGWNRIPFATDSVIEDRRGEPTFVLTTGAEGAAREHAAKGISAHEQATQQKLIRRIMEKVRWRPKNMVRD